LKTPVVLIIFNRPDTTEKVFKVIAQVKPSKLLVIADGPRPDQPGEAEACAAARAVIEQVDWPCQILTNYSDVNLGCAHRVSSGLNWAFSIVETAIVLEDDCLPHPTFFRFCEELLERYLNDERVMVISGDNFQFGRRRTEYSYYFSSFSHCWGWATWRRAWQHYDHKMTLWPTIRDSGWLKDIFLDPKVVKYWTDIFQSTYEERVNSWAYRWQFTCWTQSGLTVLPNTNLVSNIGFGSGATHTVVTGRLADMPREALHFPLRHPPFVIRDAQADKFTEENVFMITTRLERLKNKVKSLSNR